MADAVPVYEVYAVKYAEHARTASANFIGGDGHDGPMPMDYFVWVLKGPDAQWVVDTGFNQSAADARGRRLLHNPAEAIGLVGLRAEQVRNVIITHLHYDHAGNCDLFGAATFHLQDREMQYATGRYMAHRCMHEAYSVFDVIGMVQNVYGGRVRFHDGDAELAPGISVHLIGGHTLGLQVVRVHTARGWIVLASDASHYYRNMHEERPFPIVANVGEMVEGWHRLRQLADSPEHIIPGHDPQVLVRFPPATASLRGRVARVDLDPINFESSSD
ncbi:N-acyl homoserine lactonase (plasmid) [Variovorax sp. SRS16]|uniref:N-acyl homoserine lactonase family protein n=1 Tax=Variovorax sp. SRS16 TaxID=282217 RepID=UPI0013184FC4|nr:N-acyl homoserine lactonase family protein [Variovorax sp. SRS16]VTU46348.1 N-acyl homoserine lactonase [Variovorax sp. SRS16]